MEIPQDETALIVSAGEGISASLARLLNGNGVRVARSAGKLDALWRESDVRDS